MQLTLFSAFKTPPTNTDVSSPCVPAMTVHAKFVHMEARPKPTCDDWNCPRCNFYYYARRKRCLHCDHPKHRNWRCAFSSRHNQPDQDRCHCCRTLALVPEQSSSPTLHEQVTEEARPKRPREPPAGSWQCSCGNVNYPSRAICSCRGCNLSRPAAGPTAVVDQAGKIVRDATHAPADASRESDTVTASAERITPSQARPTLVGMVHHGAAGAGRVVPPLDTGMACHSGEPYHCIIGQLQARGRESNQDGPPMRPNGSTLTALPSPRLSRPRTSCSGSSGPSVRPQCKGPLRESGLREGYSESRCAPVDNCRSDVLYLDRGYYSSLPSLP